MRLRNKMRFLPVVLCFVLTAFVCVSCSSAPAGYKEYDDRDAEFYIVYPEEWEKRSYDGSVINFFSPPEDAEDTFYENVGVVTIPLVGYDMDNDGLADKISLEKYIELSKSDIGYYIDEYTEISETNIKLGDLDGKRMVYTGKEKMSADTTEGEDTSEEKTEDGEVSEERVTYKWIQVIAIHDEVAYIITYTSLTDSPEIYVEMFDKMIENCKIG